MNDNGNDTILIIGGGIAGITAAVEAAEVGSNVILVEKEAYLGGRVITLNNYFPKLCPPTCGLEINFRRIRTNPRIQVLMPATVEKVSGEAGNFDVTIDVQATDLDALSDDEKTFLLTSAPRSAVTEAKKMDVKVGAIIVATGWTPYDAAKLDTLGYEANADVITNMEMERLASTTGPTAGKIQRADGSEPTNVAFVQCAGSRDENHLPYCSAVCCMGSLKQARYVREKLPEANVTIFYIDIRTIGRHEGFYYELLEDDHVKFVKGKVAKVNEDGGKLKLDVEDTLAGKLHKDEFDMVVLATGVVPNNAEAPVEGAATDDYGFIFEGMERNGIYGVGCARRPIDVSRSVKDATAAALKAIQDVRR